MSSSERKHNGEINLIRKLVDGLGRLTKRWTSSNLLSKPLFNSTSNLIKTQHNQCIVKSSENLDFIRYIEEVAGNSGTNNIYTTEAASQWEILSQIHHTPYGLHEIRHKSLNDLSSAGTNKSKKKRTQKINGILDFLLQQMLSLSTINRQNIDSCIENLILESCVEKIILLIDDVIENVQKRSNKFMDYLSIVYSPETSNSDSDLTRQNQEISTNFSLLNRQSSIINSSENSSKKSKRSRVGLTFPNMSPVSEKSTYNYQSKRKTLNKNESNKKKKNNKSYELKNQSNLQHNRYKMSNEYQSYVSAKKESHCSKSSQNSVSIPSVKLSCSSQINRINKINEKNNKIKLVPQKVDNNLKCQKLQNTFSYKAYKKTFKKDFEEMKKIDLNDKISKLVIIKASSIDCLSDNCQEITKPVKHNSKILSVQNIQMVNLRKKEFKISPVNITCVGDVIENHKRKINTKCKNIKNHDICKSVSTNLKWNNDVKIISDNKIIKNSNLLKSISAFGRNSLIKANTKRPLQISNYYVVKTQQDESVNFNCLNDSIIQNKESPSSEIKSNDQLINITTNGMTNNNNDILEKENSENEIVTTDSAFTFHAVKAKYYQQVLPITYTNVEPNTNDANNNDANNNIMSQYINIDPNPEEIKSIYEKVMNINCWTNEQTSCGKTFSCSDEINGNFPCACLPSALTSQSFISKYNTSSEEEGDIETENSSLECNKICADEFTQYPSLDEDITQDIQELKTELKQNNLILSSIVDVTPECDENQDLDENSSIENTSQFHPIMYNNSSKKQYPNKRLHKNISENLLKHTFASQQKIRLKFEQ